MAKLRHIALIVEDPEKSAQFFEQAFDMKRAGTARRGIYMTDGTPKAGTPANSMSCVGTASVGAIPAPAAELTCAVV